MRLAGRERRNHPHGESESDRQCAIDDGDIAGKVVMVTQVGASAPTVAIAPTDGVRAKPAGCRVGDADAERKSDESAGGEAHAERDGDERGGLRDGGADGDDPGGAGDAAGAGDAVNDPDAEVSETAVVTLAADPAYTVGTPANATVTIASDDPPTVTVVATDAAAGEAGRIRGRSR